MDPAPSKARKGPQAKGGREGVPSEPPQPEAFDTADLRKSIDEAEKQQSRRRVEANETVEVDLRVNTAKVHVNQDVLALRRTRKGTRSTPTTGTPGHAWSPGGTCQSAYELSLEMLVP